MKKLVENFSDLIKNKKNTIIGRAINQAARELMLAQASDWAFIMKTETMVQYAHKRTKIHINRFLKLYNDINANAIDTGWLEEIESRDNIFSDMNCSWYYLTNGKQYKD
jgi:1,4-alpha-glucan branching enzyme